MKLQFMKIKNKYQISIYEIIEENEDIENLTEGQQYYRIWKGGEFQLYEVPKVEKDGSIILSMKVRFIFQIIYVQSSESV